MPLSYIIKFLLSQNFFILPGSMVTAPFLLYLHVCCMVYNITNTSHSVVIFCLLDQNLEVYEICLKMKPQLKTILLKAVKCSIYSGMLLKALTVIG